MWLLNDRNLFLTSLEIRSLRPGRSGCQTGKWGYSSGFQIVYLLDRTFNNAIILTASIKDKERVSMLLSERGESLTMQWLELEAMETTRSPERENCIWNLRTGARVLHTMFSSVQEWRSEKFWSPAQICGRI